MIERLLDITMSNRYIPRDWKKVVVVTIYKRGDSNLELQTGHFNISGLPTNGHVIAGYLRQIWERR
jgi:hypothetical protein